MYWSFYIRIHLWFYFTIIIVIIHVNGTESKINNMVQLSNIQIRTLYEHIATINTRWDMCYSPIQSDWMVRGTNESSTIKTTAANIKSQWTIYRYTLFSNTCTFHFTRKYCSAFRGLDGRCHFQIIFWSPSKEELCMKI